MDKEELEKFILWYWEEVDGKPYDVRVSEVADWFLEYIEKNKK